TYYDFRNNDAGTGLPTDYWVVFGKPTTPTALTNSANWGNELRLTDKSFDLEKALFLGDGDPVPGLFLGDYEALKAVTATTSLPLSVALAYRPPTRRESSFGGSPPAPRWGPHLSAAPPPRQRSRCNRSIRCCPRRFCAGRPLAKTPRVWAA